MRTAAIIQARMGSSRFPGKVLKDLHGEPMLRWVVTAAQSIPGVDDVVVATSQADTDGQILEWCGAQGIRSVAGSEEDVLDRYRVAALEVKADFVLRITADCPFIDPWVCGQVLTLLLRTGADYACNFDPRGWPDGLDCEAMTRAALEQAAEHATRQLEREHVTPYIRAHRGRFRIANLGCPIPGLSEERWTVDRPSDLEFLGAVADHLPGNAPVAFPDVLRVLDRHPDLREINRDHVPGEGFLRSRLEEPSGGSRGYTASAEMLERARKVIPLGSQTFSKSHTQYPEGGAPLFLTHGDGGRVWDVDGNEYVDLVCGLLPVVLGYRDPDVAAAVQRQQDSGVSFSLATELEIELAERLVEIIPCAEMVRFGKNGTDATSAAIRIARASTGRDRVAVCGYHGWQDWYIGSTTRNRGVPEATQALTHTFPFNDLDALQELLESHRGEFAAVILEPMSAEKPRDGYLEAVARLVRDQGAILVFDEVITGFRYALGGAQELFGVTPDLAAFGKALGNGYPISAVVGRSDLMSELERAFISSTFGGETVSIAAAIAVVDKMRREPVIEGLWKTGRALAEGVRTLVAERGLEDVVHLAGMDPWMLLRYQDHAAGRGVAMRTLVMRELLAGGVLSLGSHNVCYAHDEADIASVIRAYTGAFDVLAEAIESGSVEKSLAIPVIEPVFLVR
jgi:glutamate-1-semialdehyde 2,1-aminomutase/spore coat polysaccharide biosynthesis protein SpsF